MARPLPQRRPGRHRTPVAPNHAYAIAPPAFLADDAAAALAITLAADAHNSATLAEHAIRVAASLAAALSHR